MRLNVAVLLALISCGAEADVKRGISDACPNVAATVSSDPDLEPFVAEFFTALAVSGRKVCLSVKTVTMARQPIEIEGEDTSEVAGACLIMGHGNIEISRKHWKAFDEGERRTLIFHELGHCVLGLDHAKEDANNIMAPYILDSDYTDKHWKVLTDMLFKLDMSSAPDEEPTVEVGEW